MLPELFGLALAVGGGAYGASRWYERTRPVVEGRIVGKDLVAGEELRVMLQIQGREQPVRIAIDISPRPLLGRYFSGPGYGSSAATLERFLHEGDVLRAKVQCAVGDSLIAYSLPDFDAKG
jgi:hypothetical protein